jgi:Glycerophosphoryl diester phosphodiesterase
MKKIKKIMMATLLSLSFLGNLKIYASGNNLNFKNRMDSQKIAEAVMPVTGMSQKRVIIVSGIPAAGKSSYGERISKKTNLPFISKDNIKEKFLEVVHRDILEKEIINPNDFDEETRKKIQLYGPAAYNVLFHISENLMKTNMSFVMEANFTPRYEGELNALLEKYGYEALNISFCGDMEILHKRFCKRDVSVERHPAHRLKSKMYYDIEVFKKVFTPMREFSVGNKIIVDTSDFSTVDYDGLDELAVHFLNNTPKNIRGAHSKRDLSFLQNIRIAHRGLHDITKGIPENSLPAFEKAVENNVAIQLDLHLLKDGQIVVFNDDNLKRMTGINKNIDDCTYEDIKSLKLLNTNEEIPLFKDVLNLVDGKVLLNIEFKYSNIYDINVGELEQRASDMLKHYNGKFLVQSFNPYSLKWFKDNKPEFIRGQLSYDFRDKNINKFKKFMLQYMLLNYITEPDFISYDVHSISKRQADEVKELGLPLLLWNIRTPEDLELAKKYSNSFIYENLNI